LRTGGFHSGCTNEVMANMPRGHKTNRQEKMVGSIKAIKAMSLAVALISLFGCGASLREIGERSVSISTGVFKELQEEAPVPEGEIQLEVHANIKTHLKGYYILETEKSLHGKPGYPFVLNIDGQAVSWKVDGILDVAPASIEKERKNPEGGEGMKYQLDKWIALRPGPHTVFLGLPQEDYLIRFNVTLPTDRMQVLEFTPVYAHSARRRTGFLYGIVGYEVFLNGVQIK
jgi:hypothetical protein